MSTDHLDKVARASTRAATALTERDDAICAAVEAGEALRAIGRAAGLTHAAIAKIRDRG